MKRAGRGFDCGTECDKFRIGNSKKEEIAAEMKKKGLRMTNQRSLIIDIILSSECTSCKEIFYQANKQDDTIGIATVYRLVKTLEEIGVIDRRNLYRISNDEFTKPLEGLKCELEDNKVIHLCAEEVKMALVQWLRDQGTPVEQEIVNLYQ